MPSGRRRNVPARRQRYGRTRVSALQENMVTDRNVCPPRTDSPSKLCSTHTALVIFEKAAFEAEGPDFHFEEDAELIVNQASETPDKPDDIGGTAAACVDDEVGV